MRPTPATDRSALVLSYSAIVSDPRVRRQIDWLAGSGWTVDSLGFGAHPAPEVRDHYTLADPARWTVTKWGTLLSQAALPGRWGFRLLMLRRIPRELRERVRSGAYDLIVFNETEFAPWVSDRSRFARPRSGTRAHLDLHEFHRPDRRRNTLGARLTARYYRWIRGHIAHPRFTSRTVVNDPIGELYVEEFGIPAPQQVRNAPPRVELAPSPVDPENIRMLFHGLASRRRGFEEILDAMRVLPRRFSMTFMIMPNPAMHEWLERQFADHPARDRLRIVPPAPMREIAQRINEYDLEIIFYRPVEKNLEFAQPNKFFESIQGRLGLVVGEGRTMAPIVREWGNGVVVPGFEAADLAAALGGLGATAVAEMKEASDRAADELHAEAEGRRFLAALEG